MAQFPTEFVEAAVKLRSIEMGGRTKTNGGRIIRGSTTQHRYEFTIVTQELNAYTEIPALRAFMDEIGYSGVFTVHIPVWSEPKGNTPAAATVKTAVNAGSKVVVLQNAGTSRSNITLPGDFLTFGGHTKAYMLAHGYTYSSNSSGDVTIRLTKPLIEPLAAGESVNFNPLFTVIPVNDSWEEEIDGSKGNYTSLEIEVEEYY